MAMLTRLPKTCCAAVLALVCGVNCGDNSNDDAAQLDASAADGGADTLPLPSVTASSVSEPTTDFSTDTDNGSDTDLTEPNTDDSASTDPPFPDPPFTDPTDTDFPTDDTATVPGPGPTDAGTDAAVTDQSPNAEAGATEPRPDAGTELPSDTPNEEAGVDSGSDSATQPDSGATVPDAGSETNEPPAGDAGSTQDTGGEDAAVPSAIHWVETEDEIGGVALEIAQLDVPLNYAQPSGEQLQLALARLRSTHPDRSGVFLFNPGGPGAGVITDRAGWAQYLAAHFPTLDIVLVDNRGVGHSSPLDCVDESITELLWVDDPKDPEQLAVANADYAAALQQGCLEVYGDDLRYFNSENVARDMEFVRVALGEEQLNFWGASYGTLQGQLYAKMYPDQVRAFVLDSPVVRLPGGRPDWVESMDASAAAYEHQLSRFFEWSDEDESSFFQMYELDTAQAYDELDAELYEGVEYEDGWLPPDLLATLAMYTLIAGDWDTLMIALAYAYTGDWSVIVDVVSSDILGGGDSEESFRSAQANVVINLIDSNCPPDFDVEGAAATLGELAQAYPRLGLSFAAPLAACATWTVQPTEPQIIANDVDAPPMLVMAAYNDPATPYPDAVTLTELLDNDSHLLSSSTEGHGVGGSSECANVAMQQFVVSADTSETESECEPDEIEEAAARRVGLTPPRNFGQTLPGWGQGPGVRWR